ncbi:MAG: hypothetical protein P8N02_15965, partial [Actinomycetota bacterium]|nr:hypothetical protein [Actinomycetota bacterium]
FDGPHLLKTNAVSWAVAPYQPAMLQGLAIHKRAFEEIGGLNTDLSSRHDTHFFYFAFAQRPACAVAGVTVEMTADEDMGNRLTGGTGNRGRRYAECTVRLYSEVLERRDDPNERTLARNLLGRGLKRLAVHQWRGGERIAALSTAGRAMLTSPVGVIASFLPGGRVPPRVRRAAAVLAA